MNVAAMTILIILLSFLTIYLLTAFEKVIREKEDLLRRNKSLQERLDDANKELKESYGLHRKFVLDIVHRFYESDNIEDFYHNVIEDLDQKFNVDDFDV